MKTISLEEFAKLTPRQIIERIPFLLVDNEGKAIAQVSKAQPQW